MSDLDSLFLDKRPIADMTFGAEEKTPEAQADTAARVRKILTACGVKIADDINRLGCTGVLANAKGARAEHSDIFSETAQHAALDVAKFLRLGLAGGGVGLPCFVPPDRFCLVHDTVGGLQDNQIGLYPVFVEAISRPLTEAERGKYEMVNAARTVARTDPDEAADILSGRKPVPGVIETGDAEDDDPEMTVLRGARIGVQTWRCTEHATTNWACRYCAAQAIVEGSLEPTYVFTAVGTMNPSYGISPGDSIKLLKAANDTPGSDAARLYVLAATFTRKLSRD